MGIQSFDATVLAEVIAGSQIPVSYLQLVWIWAVVPAQWVGYHRRRLAVDIRKRAR